MLTRTPSGCVVIWIPVHGGCNRNLGQTSFLRGRDIPVGVKRPWLRRPLYRLQCSTLWKDRIKSGVHLEWGEAETSGAFPSLIAGAGMLRVNRLRKSIGNPVLMIRVHIRLRVDCNEVKFRLKISWGLGRKAVWNCSEIQKLNCG